MRAFLLRLLGFFRQSSAEQDLDAELSSHLQFHIDDNIRAGMSPGEARRQALLKLGGLEPVKEIVRDRRTLPSLGNLSRDLRHAVRMLVRNPGLTAAAVVSLALGIGANTAIFSVTDALLLKSLPVQNPRELVVFAGWDPGLHNWVYVFAFREFRELRTRMTSFSGMTSSWSADRSGLIVNGSVQDERAHIGMVSANYFSLLGVQPALGRTFLDNEPAAVISHAYWERHFGLSPDVLGHMLVMNGTAVTIVGVAPRTFTGDSVGEPCDLWIPAPLVPRAIARWSQRLDFNPVRVIARLKPGVSLRQAEAEAKAVCTQLARELRTPDDSVMHQGRVALLPEGQGISRPREHYRRPLEILTIVAGLVLLIACTNAANLFLARSEARRKEIALRLALGAGRGRIVRQLLLESIVVTLPAGAAGLALAWWGTLGLAHLARDGPWAVDLNLTPDARVLVYTFVLCVLTGILFGLAPALNASKVELYAAIKGATAAPGRFRLSKSLVMVQVALSLMLLMSAGLFTRTLRNLKSQDLGFNRDSLLLIRTDAAPRGQGVPSVDAYDQIGRIPGVRSVSASQFGLLITAAFTEITVPGHPSQSAADRIVAADRVMPRYLETVGMRLVSGRDFTEHDMDDHVRLAIVNESMARRFYGSTNVIGRQFNWGGPPTDPPMVIIGVVQDAAYTTLRDRATAMIYMPEGSDWRDISGACLVVRTAGVVPGIARQVRQTLHTIAPGVTIRSIDSMDAVMDQSLAIERMVAWMAGLFGALALVLACVGLYGVMSYMAARRTSEIGIRVSLGATPLQVTRLVLGDALLLALAGVALGVPAVLIAGRSISGLLFGIRAADAATIAASVALLLAVTMAAAFIPAWRASRTDPVRALRSEA